MRVLPLAILMATGASPAFAQDVALLFTFNPAMTPCWETDPQTKVMATGYFNSVSTIDVGIATPTLAQLQAYDAVLLYQDFPGYLDAVALGDVLADYVDVGGGVVIAGFANFSNWQPLGGRWTMGYEVILSANQLNGQATLGTVHDASHPAMAGVTSFDGGGLSWRPLNATLAPGSTPIADWSDGTPLVAQGMNPLRVDLGFFPPSTDCTVHGWDSSTDGDLMLGGALVAVLGGSGSLGQNFECSATVSNSTGQPGVIEATGSATASNNDVLLTATQLPNNQFGYFLNSPNQNPGGFVPPGSQGRLCIGPQSIGRYNQPGSIFNTAGMGMGMIQLDLANTPTPTGSHAIVAGETWYFTCWFRDNNPGSTSNFTDAVCITFS